MAYNPLTLIDIDTWTNDNDHGTGNMLDAIENEQDRIYIRGLLERFLLEFNDTLTRGETQSAVVLVRVFLDVFRVIDNLSSTLGNSPLGPSARVMLKDLFDMKIRKVLTEQKNGIKQRAMQALTLAEPGYG